MEGEYDGKYLGDQSKCRGVEYVGLVIFVRHRCILEARSTTWLVSPGHSIWQGRYNDDSPCVLALWLIHPQVKDL